VRNSKDFTEDEFENLKDAEYIERFTSKQIKSLRTNPRNYYNVKKQSNRKQRHNKNRMLEEE